MARVSAREAERRHSIGLASVSPASRSGAGGRSQGLRAHLSRHLLLALRSESVVARLAHRTVVFRRVARHACVVGKAREAASVLADGSYCRW